MAVYNDAPAVPSSTQPTPTVTNDAAITPPKPNYLVCDRTGFKLKVNKGLQEEWTGSQVREESFEFRNMQDFQRSSKEERNGSDRPERKEDLFADDKYNGEVSLTDLDG